MGRRHDRQSLLRRFPSRRLHLRHGRRQCPQAEPDHQHRHAHQAGHEAGRHDHRRFLSDRPVLPDQLTPSRFVMQTLCMTTQRRKEDTDAKGYCHLPFLRRCGPCAFALRFLSVDAIAILGVGCRGTSIKTYPISGKVEVKDGDVAMLTGSSVQLVQEGDETIRPYGDINASGNFTVKVLYKGDILQGAPAGKYKARIMLGDESNEGVPSRKGKGNVIHPRFLEFDKSGLSIAVPSSDYTVSLSKK